MYTVRHERWDNGIQIIKQETQCTSIKEAWQILREVITYGTEHEQPGDELTLSDETTTTMIAGYDAEQKWFI